LVCRQIGKSRVSGGNKVVSVEIRTNRNVTGCLSYDREIDRADDNRRRHESIPRKFVAMSQIPICISLFVALSVVPWPGRLVLVLQRAVMGSRRSDRRSTVRRADVFMVVVAVVVRTSCQLGTERLDLPSGEGQGIVRRGEAVFERQHVLATTGTMSALVVSDALERVFGGDSPGAFAGTARCGVEVVVGVVAVC
jgi:hypothetical protein